MKSKNKIIKNFKLYEKIMKIDSTEYDVNDIIKLIDLISKKLNFSKFFTIKILKKGYKSTFGNDDSKFLELLEKSKNEINELSNKIKNEYDFKDILDIISYFKEKFDISSKDALNLLSEGYELSVDEVNSKIINSFVEARNTLKRLKIK